MGVSTLGRTLEQVNDFEEQQVLFYSELKSRTRNPGACLIADYLATRKLHVPQAKDCYSEEEMDIICCTPILEERVVSDIAQFFRSRALSTDASSNMLLDRAIEFAQVLLTTYRHIIEQRIGDKAIAFMTSLYTIEVRDIKELNKIKAMDYF